MNILKFKKYTYTLLAAFCIVFPQLPLVAQKNQPMNRPMIQEGKEWYYRSVYPVRGADETYYRKIQGDTLINEIAYKKLVNGSGQFTDGLRQEGQDVYSKSLGFLYNFDAHVSDTLNIESDMATVVTTRDSILVDGQNFLRLGTCPLFYTNERIDFHSPMEYWVEGVGSNYGIYPVWGLLIIGPHEELDSCKVDGKLLFTRNDFLRVPHSERQWVYGDYRIMNVGGQTPYLSHYSTRTYATIGEVEHNGRTYQKVYECTTSRNAGTDADTRYKYLFAMRHEDGRVLADAESYRATFAGASDDYPTNDEGEYILYDYNVQAGESYLGTEKTVIEAGDTILADGQAHRLLVLSSGHQLIEGIGCVNVHGTPFDYLGQKIGAAEGFDFSLLENYYDAEGHRIYVNTREKAYQTIVNGVESVSTTVAHIADDAVYDLQGRRMDAHHLQKGVYIQHGRKFVVK